jgi:hypothetical protein
LQFNDLYLKSGRKSEAVIMPFEMELPYREALSGILAFSTFAQAEQTLKSLEKICRNYEAASDKKGVEYCRRIAALGRGRAELISHNKRVDPQKRLQKKEIAMWFRVWLETPAIFDDWLALRKSTEKFKMLGASEHSGHTQSGE